MKHTRLIGFLSLPAAWCALGLSQQSVPFQNGIPVAPKGLAGKKLPKLPMEFDTAEGQRIRVVAVTRELEYPWSLAFLPDGAIWSPSGRAAFESFATAFSTPSPCPARPHPIGP